MATGTLISVEEYLRTAYDPDCEYLDGEVVERNMGETDHSYLQGLIIAALSRDGLPRVYVFPELRVQTGSQRYRIPDVLVTTSRVKGRILKEPPFVCIEILSPEDRASRVEARLEEYLQFGVPHVWLIDPRRRKAWVYTGDGRRESSTVLETTNPVLQLSLNELFNRMDEDVDLEGG